MITVLCFEGYLRLTEALGLKSEHISLPNEERAGAIRLPKTKTGLNQSVTIRNHSLLGLFLTTYLEHHSQKLFDSTTNTVRQGLKRACRKLGVDPGAFTAHSLRHGGATTDYIHGVPLAEIIVRGRWAVAKTATRYIQSGRSLMISLQLPSNLTQHGEQLAQDPKPLLRRLKKECSK
jgi:integrase